MATITSTFLFLVILIAVLAVLTLVLPRHTGTSLARFFVSEEAERGVGSVQPTGVVQEVVTDESGNLRVTVLDDDQVRHVIVRKVGGMTISVSFDPEAEFHDPAKFSLVVSESTLPEDIRRNDRDRTETIIRIVDANLRDRHFQEGNVDSADLLVRFHGISEGVVHPTNPSRTDSSVLSDRAEAELAELMAQAMPGSQIERRGIVLEFHCARTGQPVWRAAAHADLDPYIDDAAMSKRIEEAIRLMLADYPPPVA